MRSMAATIRRCCGRPSCFSAPSASPCIEQSLIAADEETVGGSSRAPVSPLVSMLGIPAEANIDVLNDGNADAYWERSDQFDMAIDLTAGQSRPCGAWRRR